MARPNIKTQAFLASLPLFNEIGPAELDAIATSTTELHHKSGDVVFNRGDPCIGFHLVIYGQVKLSFLTPDGNEKVIEIVGPGGSFGEALMFLGKPYIVNAQALADSFLLHVARDAVFRELEHTPSFARKMLAGLSRRLHGLINDVEAYSLQSGTQRVIGYLLRQNQESHDNDATCVVTLPTSKANVASRLNVTPEHFSRILHQLIDEKLITVEGREVTILDIGRLGSFRA
ncbi:MAG: Crp/Fnr family transcriptional regulator [Casimicrobiaceae bacterium]